MVMDLASIDCAPTSPSGAVLQQAKFKIPFKWGALKLDSLDSKIKLEVKRVEENIDCSKTTIERDSSDPVSVSDSVSDLLDDVLDGLGDSSKSFEDFCTLEEDLEISFDSVELCDSNSISTGHVPFESDLEHSSLDYSSISSLQLEEGFNFSVTKSCYVRITNVMATVDWNIDNTTELRSTRVRGRQHEELACGGKGDEMETKQEDPAFENFSPELIEDEIELRELKEETCSGASLDVKAHEVKDEFFTGRRKKFYPPTFKSQVLDYCIHNGPVAAARKFDLSKFLVLEWKKKAGIKVMKVASSKKGSHTKLDKIFKENVLSYYGKFGLDKTCKKFNISNSLIYTWKKKGIEDKPMKSYKYSSEFKEEVVKTCETQGFRKTAKSLNLNLSTLWKWKKKAGTIRSQKSDEYKKEVLEYCSKHGKEAAFKMFETVSPYQIWDWKKKFASELELEELAFKTNEQKFKTKIVQFSKENGLKATAQKFNVSLPNIWDWKAKENKRLKQVKARKSAAGKIPDRDPNFEEYSPELKKTIVECYKDYGSKYCEEQYKVPRQTVRNWAIKMGDAEIGMRMINVERKEVLEMARREGVKKALQKYPVKRATLYVWAKVLGVEVFEGLNHSIEMTVNQQGVLKKVVFGRVKKPKKEKVKKPKKEKKIKVKPKKPEVKGPSMELPVWAKDFIKSTKTPQNNVKYNNTLPSVLSSEPSNLISESTSTVFDCDIFSLSIPVTYGSLPKAPLDLPDSSHLHSEDPDPSQSSDSDSSSESEYECDEDSDFLFHFPFFSPTNQFHDPVDPSLSTIDPPNTIRRRTPGQGIPK